MVVGTLRVDLLLGDVRSLKEKRSRGAADRGRAAPPVRGGGRRGRAPRPAPPVPSWRSRSWPPTPRTVVEVLDGCERLVAGRPEVELLGARRRVLDDDD